MADKKTLLWKLLPTYLVILILTLISLNWYTLKSLKQHYLSENEESLGIQTKMVKSLLLDETFSLVPSELDDLCKRLFSRIDTRITIIDRSGQVLADSEKHPQQMDNHGSRPEVLDARKSGKGVSTRYSTTLKTEMMYLAITYKDSSGIDRVIRTSMPLDKISDTFFIVYSQVFTGVVFITIVAVFISFYVAYRLSRPIQNLIAGAKRFTYGDLDHRIMDISDTREFDALAKAMNVMADQLQERLSLVSRQSSELEGILSGMTEAVLVVNIDEQLIRFNKAAQTLFKLDPESSVNRHIVEAIRNAPLQNFVKKALETQTHVESNLVIYNEEDVMLHSHGNPLFDDKGEFHGTLIVLHDITRLYRLENMRREFVANVSHELKSPITAIKGFVETLQEGAFQDRENAERFLDIILKHTNQLNALIEDLLKLSRLENDSSSDDISFEPGALESVLQSSVSVCQNKAAERNLIIEVDCQPDIRVTMNTGLLEQAVINLLDNAIKYSRENGTITLIGETDGRDAVIRVQDEGIGIEPEHIPRLFERFYRVDKSRSRNLGGTGLGLSIVKHVVQVHGGSISVDSEPEKGSAFTIKLPVI
jgi:two-component system, OmpR family, phosphate regulon sensor histidine kinase PhoR